MAKKIILFGAGIAMLAMPFAAFAQFVEYLPEAPVAGIEDIINVLNFVVRIVFTVLMIAAIGFILFAAFKYLTAMGDAAKIQEAHKALLGAAAAIAVALLATGVRAIVESVLRARG